MNVQATSRTPAIQWDPSRPTLTISGTSIPENAHGFYRPVIELCKEIANGPLSGVTVRIDLRYFNSSSMKSLFTLLEPFRASHAQGRSVNVEWTVEEEDEFMQESGETLMGLLGIPFRFVPTAPGAGRPNP